MNRLVCCCLGGLLGGLVYGCTFGSSALLHHPNEAGRVGGYLGYSIPIQPARARVVAVPTDSAVTPPVTRHVSANTAWMRPAVWPWYAGFISDPMLFGSLGLTDHMTLVGEMAWHRVGLSLDFFSLKTGTRGIKLAGGATAGSFVPEYHGWVEGGWLPRLSEALSGYVGAGMSIGRFRHLLGLPSNLDGLDSANENETIPTVKPFADLLREEIRLRLPLGLAVRQSGKGATVSFAAIPYVTLAHGDPWQINCYKCEADVTIEDFEQRFGLELQAGIRL